MPCSNAEQSADTHPSVKHPSEPFNKASADIILRSSDNVDFRVYRGILVASSSFFETMFALPQPPKDSSHDNLSPIIPVSEDSRILDNLLRLIYPLVDRVSEDLTLEDACSVLEAAMKYDIPTAVELMRQFLLDFAEKEPLQVYAKACILHVESVAQHAAQEAMKLSTADFNCYVEDFKKLPAGCYHRLLQARVKSTASSNSANYDLSSTAFCRPTPKESTSVAACPSQAQPEWQDAESPFDRSDADTIVISKDRVRFRLHSAILKMASPVLEGMLRAQDDHPQNGGGLEQDKRLPGLTRYVLVLPESSVVLYDLFPLLYPVHQDYLSDIISEYDTLRALTNAAVKYSMHGVVAWIKVHHLPDLEPYQMWLLASLFGWVGEIKTAAKRTLELDATKLQAMYEPDLECISTTSYFRLLQYHQDCRTAASAAAVGIDTSAYNSDPLEVPPNFRVTCSECEEYVNINVPKLKLASDCQAYAKEASLLLQRRPHATILSDPVVRKGSLKLESGEAVFKPTNSKMFVSEVFRLLDTFEMVFTKAIDGAIAKVSADLLSRDCVRTDYGAVCQQVEFSAGSLSQLSTQSDDGQSTTDD